jgi:hypothetical protein
MRITISLLIGFVLAITAGCTITPTATPTVIPSISSKQPIVEGPIIRGRISGLPQNGYATINVRSSSNQIRESGKRGNGDWEFAAPFSSEDLIVTAAAEGYVSKPISYTIHLDGMIAYVVEGGQVTANEAKHLDFDFVK